MPLAPNTVNFTGSGLEVTLDKTMYAIRHSDKNMYALLKQLYFRWYHDEITVAELLEQAKQEEHLEVYQRIA